MRLADLEPEWVNDAHTRGDALDAHSAQGIMFLCPACFRRNGGAVGTHAIRVWFRNRGVPVDAVPGPGRWDVVSGESFDDLTLSPSIDLTDHGRRPNEWHGHVRAGEVSESAAKGRSPDLLDFPRSDAKRSLAPLG